MDEKDIKRINEELARRMKELGVVPRTAPERAERMPVQNQIVPQNISDEASICRVHPDGVKRWWDSNGLRHRIYGPAVEMKDGSKVYYNHGRLHRIDGPAVELSNGRKEWWVNGIRHRIDGPAVEYPGGPIVGFENQWWWGGKKMTEREFRSLLDKPLRLRQAVKLEIEAKP